MDLLSAEEELELAQKWRDNGDEKALHTLTSAYIKLVISIATRFKRYGLPLSDLVQEGNVGLMQAAARFEPERGFRFSTYANWWIRSSIQEYVLRNWSIVRAGATVAHKSLFFSMRRLKARIEDFDESLSPEARRYIAKELNVREVDVEHMAGRLSGADRSLNAPLKAAEGSTSWQDILPDDDRYTPEMEVMNVRDDRTRSELIAESLKVLNERELHIVRARKLSGETDSCRRRARNWCWQKEARNQTRFRSQLTPRMVTSRTFLRTLVTLRLWRPSIARSTSLLLNMDSQAVL